MVCEPAEVGSVLRRVLEAIDAGELEATVTGRARIEGAVVACEVLAGGDLSELVERLRGGEAVSTSERIDSFARPLRGAVELAEQIGPALRLGFEQALNDQVGAPR